MTWVEALPTAAVSLGLVLALFKTRSIVYHWEYRGPFDKRVSYVVCKYSGCKLQLVFILNANCVVFGTVIHIFGARRHAQLILFTTNVEFANSPMKWQTSQTVPSWFCKQHHHHGVQNMKAEK